MTCHLPGVREIEGEAVQDIPIHLDVFSQSASSLFSSHHRALQMLQLPRSHGTQVSVFFSSSREELADAAVTASWNHQPR